MAAIDDYVSAFQHLHRDMHHRWAASTLNGAPHKPLLLLAVMDAAAAGEVLGDTIALTPELQQRFQAYWRALRIGVGLDEVRTPFRHMASEPFWHHVPSIEVGRPTATIDPELAALARDAATAQHLKMVLIDTYFDGDVRDRLWDAVGRLHGGAPSAVHDERAWREGKWQTVREAADTGSDVTIDWLKELGIYKGAWNIWADHSRTNALTPDGVGVAATIHTSERQGDDLVADGGIAFKYPPSSSLIEAAKNSARLNLPVFVVSHAGDDLRRVNMASVEDWDDSAQTFWLTLVDRPALPAVEERPFILREKRVRQMTDTARRPGQTRFEFEVFKRYGARCVICDLGIKDVLDAAHIVPWADGGTDDPRNGLVLCANHHRAYERRATQLEPTSLRLLVRDDLHSLVDPGITSRTLDRMPCKPHDAALSWRHARWSKSVGLN